MCLEVYSTEQPVQIPFAHETVRFLSLRSFRIRYIVLVRNVGYKGIDLLSVIFPRPIYRFVEEMREGSPAFAVNVAGVVNATQRLPELGYFFGRPINNRLRARLADPNNPVCDLPWLEGAWNPDNATMIPPQGLTRRCFLILDAHRFTAWNVGLAQLIAPGDAHWFCWEVTVENEGDALADTLQGPMVFHELSSPIDVRQTIVETLHGALRDIHEYGPEPGANSEQEVAIRRILLALGLYKERQVDIQYYELSVQPGDPRTQWLTSHVHQGDIRLRSSSPRVGRHQVWDSEFLDEPIYEWKSGSILEPAHPWRNLGFSVRLTLCGKKARPPRRRKGS
jgi:hypothetical protein